MRPALLLFVFLTTLSVSGQPTPLGSLYSWRSHLPYIDAIALAQAGSSIYVATPTGLFVYDYEDQSVRTLSKSDGFSANTPSALAYDAAHDKLLIGYKDGGLDILTGGSIYQEHAYRKSGTTDKAISHITISGDTALLTTGQGIVEYNVRRRFFIESYLNIDSTCSNHAYLGGTVMGDTFFVASAEGVQCAPRHGKILQDCNNWPFINRDSCVALSSFAGRVWGAFSGGRIRTYMKGSWNDFLRTEGSLKSLTISQGKLIVGSEKEVITISDNLSVDSFLSNQQNDVLLGGDGRYYTAKNAYALVADDRKNNVQFIYPNGPGSLLASHLYADGESVWAASGDVDASGAPIFSNQGFYRYAFGFWSTFNARTVKNWNDLRDPIAVRFDSVTKRVLVASLDSALLEFDNIDQFTKSYTAVNSSLQPAQTGRAATQVTGFARDYHDNLWVTNYRVSRPLSVQRPSGEWMSFSVEGVQNLVDVLVDGVGQVWVLSRFEQNGLAVYSPGDSVSQTFDDKTRRFYNTPGQGNLPSSGVNCMVADLEYNIWVGTNDGVAYYRPELVFSQNFDATRPVVGTGSQAGNLLSGQSVTAIAIDGANRKWFGTRSGLYLTDPQGTKIISAFTTQNSPLPSDNIRSITIAPKTGEVFIATDQGIVSYRGDATLSTGPAESPHAFPNPVRPDYRGPIAIRGLPRSADVRVTDVSGHLVAILTSAGGQAVWDGRTNEGREVASGVYLVHATGPGENGNAVAKIFVIR